MKHLSLHEQLKYGSLIVKFMTYHINVQEEIELHEWVVKDQRNMSLFENLIDDNNQEWAKKWFYNAGVSTRGIKWKKKDGWYKPETKNICDFYILMAGVFVFLLIVYLVLEYL